MHLLTLSNNTGFSLVALSMYPNRDLNTVRRFASVCPLHALPISYLVFAQLLENIFIAQSAQSTQSAQSYVHNCSGTSLLVPGFLLTKQENVYKITYKCNCLVTPCNNILQASP